MRTPWAGAEAEDLADFVMPMVPPAEAGEALMACAQDAQQRLASVQSRLAARVVTFVEIETPITPPSA